MHVRVYWNVTKGLWSLQDLKTNRVLSHKYTLCLTDAKFVVRKAGQARVRRENRKNVHAFVVGKLVKIDDKGIDPTHYRRVKYNPYVNDTFISEDKPIERADAVVFYRDGSVFAS